MLNSKSLSCSYAKNGSNKTAAEFPLTVLLIQ